MRRSCSFNTLPGLDGEAGTEQYSFSLNDGVCTKACYHTTYNHSINFVIFNLLGLLYYGTYTLDSETMDFSHVFTASKGARNESYQRVQR